MGECVDECISECVIKDSQVLSHFQVACSEDVSGKCERQ